MDNWDFGLPLAGYAAEVERPRGAVLLLHGYGEHVGRYAHVVEALNAANVSVYSYDQRGHGASQGPRALFRVNDLVRDHLAAREWLRSNLKVPLFALGHSLGGLVTALSVARDPRGLAGVVLSSPALIVGEGEPAMVRRLSGVMSVVAPSLAIGAVKDGVLSRREEVNAAFGTDPLNYQGRVKARSGHEMMRGGDGLWPRLSDWTLPTLIIHGDADRLITVEGSRRFAREIASSDKELWEVAGGYHELFNDLESERAVEKVAGWIGRRLA